jgi:hypothetical protein
MAISSFPPVSTGGGVASVTFDYPTSRALRVFPWSRDTWTAAKVYFTADKGQGRTEGAIVGFLNSSRQPIGSAVLKRSGFSPYSNYFRNTTNEYSNLGILPQFDTVFDAIEFSGVPAFITLYSENAGTFVIEESVKNTAVATNGTLTTITSSNPTYSLAAASFVTVIGGGGGGRGAPAFNYDNTGGGSGHTATAFLPAGTYAATIGAGGAGGNTGDGAIGGTTTFTGTGGTVSALGGNQTSAGVFSQGGGGSSASAIADRFTSFSGVAGQNGSEATNASGVVPPPWVPFQIQPSGERQPGRVYGGGGSTSYPLGGGGPSAPANTGGGGGAGGSNNNSAQPGGNGGSGIIYIWTPPA